MVPAILHFFSWRGGVDGIIPYWLPPEMDEFLYAFKRLLAQNLLRKINCLFNNFLTHDKKITNIKHKKSWDQTQKIKTIKQWSQFYKGDVEDASLRWCLSWIYLKHFTISNNVYIVLKNIRSFKFIHPVYHWIPGISCTSVNSETLWYYYLVLPLCYALPSCEPFNEQARIA